MYFATKLNRVYSICKSLILVFSMTVATDILTLLPFSHKSSPLFMISFMSTCFPIVGNRKDWKPCSWSPGLYLLLLSPITVRMPPVQVLYLTSYLLSQSFFYLCSLWTPAYIATRGGGKKPKAMSSLFFNASPPLNSTLSPSCFPKFLATTFLNVHFFYSSVPHLVSVKKLPAFPLAPAVRGYAHKHRIFAINVGQWRRYTVRK